MSVEAELTEQWISSCCETCKHSRTRILWISFKRLCFVIYITCRKLGSNPLHCIFDLQVLSHCLALINFSGIHCFQLTFVQSISKGKGTDKDGALGASLPTSNIILMQAALTQHTEPEAMLSMPWRPVLVNWVNWQSKPLPWMYEKSSK